MNLIGVITAYQWQPLIWFVLNNSVKIGHMSDTNKNSQDQALLEAVTWNDQGLVPVIAQEVGSGDVLMMDGIACHTGEHSCFFMQWDSVSSNWQKINKS